MDNFEVAIICTTYNHEPYVREAFDSFLMQKTNFDFKIVVHDDASTDNTQSIIKEYASKYPDKFYTILQTENKYQKGEVISKYIFDKISSKYYAFCEGDDYWTDPYKLQKQYDALKNNPTCSCCTSLVTCCDDKGNKLDKVYPQENYNLNNSCLIKSDKAIELLYTKRMYPFQTSSYFVKKEAMDLCISLFDSDFDRNMLLSACLTGDFYYINESMSMYRRFTTYSWSKTNKENNKEKRNSDLYDLLKFDLIFDQYTDYKFHSLVLNKIYRDIFEISKTNGSLSKEIYKNNKGSFTGMVNLLGLKKALITFFSMFFPDASFFIRKHIKHSI